MSWEIKYNKGEKFIYSHSKNWPFRNFRQIKELNKLKNEMKEDDISEFDKIEIGNDSLLPEMLNINLIIHIGEMEKLKKEYNKILGKNKKHWFSYHDNPDINILKRTPINEYEQALELDSIVFVDDEYYKCMDCSIYRITESFLQVSFRFHFVKQVYDSFFEILSNYSKQEYKINNFKLSQMNSMNKNNIYIYNNTFLTKNNIYQYLKKIKIHAFSVLNKKILDLHIGSKRSIFSLYVFSYLDTNKDKKNNQNSIFGRLNLQLKNNFTTDKNELSFKYEIGKWHILDSNSEILFFNKDILSEKDLAVYGGKLSNYISSNIRISVETTLSQDFSINSLLVYYYEILNKYRFKKTKQYSKLAYSRYNKFLNETLFLKSFVNEYNRNYDQKLSKYLFNLGDLKSCFGENHQIDFSEVIYKKIENQLQSIQALNLSISDIISSKKDDAIIKSNKRLQIIVIILTIVNICVYVFNDIKNFIITMIH